MQTEDHDTFGVASQTARKIKELRHKAQELISPHSGKFLCHPPHIMMFYKWIWFPLFHPFIIVCFTFLL